MQGFFFCGAEDEARTRDRPAWKAGALPTELLPQVIIFKTLSCFGAEDESSNSRQPAWKAGALPTELLPHYKKVLRNTHFVGANILQNLF